MAKRPSIQTILAEVEESKQELLESIEEKIELVEERMKPYEALNQKKQELVAARRALLGGSRLTGAGSGARIRQEDVVDWLRKNEGGHGSQEIADGINGSEPSVRAHLNRGKDERFLKKDSKWYLRDPKNGINTVEDIDAEDEEEDEDDGTE